ALARLALGVFERQHTHADQIRAVDALEALGDHRAHTEEPRALRRPIARGAGAIFLAGEDHERRAARLIFHGRVVDRHLLAGRAINRVAAFLAAQHLVLDADIGEGAAHHDLVIAAARAIGVEIAAVDAVADQIAAGGARLLDRAGRADVIGRDGIA